MLKKITIFLIFLLLSAALLFGIWYLIKIKGWPLWVGASIFAGIIGFILIFIFLRRYLLRRNERKFVKRVIAQEGDSVFASSQDNTFLISDLEKQWDKAIKTLYKSKLNKNKNAIYALPWFLVIGESGAGKTSLIKNSRLSSALTDVDASSQYSGTKNCDWWFFEDAIILDTAGRYSIPTEERRDNAEWERFLSLLSKYRKKEPLNGVVVTMSVERLLENDKDLIQEDALNIRKRINQLMASIGAKFPVYLMISKMDHLYGFTDFCEVLPEALQTQAMGYMNESLNQNWDEVIDEGIAFIKQKITSLQLLSVENKSTKAKEILLFSKEFEQVSPALKDFSQIVFGENPYQQIPTLRGIYFSSALSDGESNSQFLSDFNLPQSNAKAQNKAYFITDFFKIILPHDRNIFTPIKEYLTWQRRNYKIALTSWLLVFISISGIYTYLYIQNIKVISDAAYIKKFNENFNKMSLTARILSIDKLRLNIIKIDNLNKNAMFSFLKLNQSVKAEENLKNLFQDKFSHSLYREFSFKMNESMEKITNATPSDEVVSYVGFFIDSIDILRQVLKNKDEIEISKHLSTWIKNILSRNESSVEPSVSYLFVKNYIAYLKWNQDKAVVEEQIQMFQNFIALIVEKKGSNLHWLTDEGVSQTPSIKISTFFKNIDADLIKNSSVVSGSLTQQGRTNLIEDIKILEKEMQNSTELKAKLKLFWKWYDKRFYYRWKNLALSMSNMESLLKFKNNEQLLYTMTNDKNPYFDFIHTMATELKAYKSLGKAPEWTKLVIELDTTLSIANNIRNSKNSLLSKVQKDKDTLIANAEAKTDQNLYIKQIKSATIFNQYIGDLSKLSTIVDKKQSKKLLSDFFSDSAKGGKLSLSFNTSQDYYNRFIHSLTHYDNVNFIYNLIAGPKNYIINYSINQIDEMLNSEWERSVIGALPLSTNRNLLMSLFNNQKGLVWKYVKGDIKPFLKLDQYGYSAKTRKGYKLDIDTSFLRYINSGINLLSDYKPQYDISISALPFNVNQGSKEDPNYVNLHLRCAKSDYILKNENYNLTKLFSWVPSKCGDTILTFGFDNFKVTKTYKGENGFLYFLKDFKTGTKIFITKDFDNTQVELKQNNITSIKVIYDIKNEGNILKLLDKTPYEVPKKVTGAR